MRKEIHIVCCQVLAAFFLIACGLKARAQQDPNLYPLDTDITHVDLDIRFNWDSLLVYGKATITAKPYSGTKSDMVLDANGFTIHGVELQQPGGTLRPLTYRYEERKLHINLDRAYDTKSQYKVIIRYTARPEKLRVGRDIPSSADRGMYFVNMPDKSQQVWTQGATECNSSWMPTINSPREKYTQQFSLTVPSAYVSLSNGIMVSSAEHADGTRTDTWKLDQPHSSYLSMVAAGKFVITRDQWKGMEVNYYMEPAFAPMAKRVFGNTPEMLTFYSTTTGIPYPWPKYSQIVVREFVSGAMENTTASLFFDKLNMSEGQYLDENYEEYVAHELFHHWFGNLVTAESWSNLALNESFATYGEYLWLEYKYGRDEADRHALRDASYYFATPGKKREDLIRYDYSDREEMFDVVTYMKGGRIVHMLRKTVGDTLFFRSLNRFLKDYAYSSANVNDLQRVFEETSGQDLDWFFEQWFTASGHPVLDIRTGYDQQARQVTIRIRQKQDKHTPVYRLPLWVDIYHGEKKERRQIVVTGKDQVFTLPFDTAPDLVNVDAEKSLLAIKTEKKSVQQYIFQYAHAPLYPDRYEALTALIKRSDDPAARATISKALYDPSWSLRRLVLEQILVLSPQERLKIYGRIKEMALNDERSLVRAEAITVLKNYFTDQDNSEIYRQAANDKALSVAKALKGAL